MKKFYLLALVGIFVSATKIHAYDFTAPDVNGNTIYYNYLGGDSVAVSHKTDYHYSGDIIIPSHVSDGNAFYRVIEIEQFAFNYSIITSVEIPSSIKRIGKQAFCECNALKKLNITDIAVWCNVAFADNTANPLFYCQHLYLNNTKITDLVIPDGVTSIAFSAFYNCRDITSLTIPNSVTSIGKIAFYGCSSLTSVTIPIGVTSIGDYAFSSCSGLTSIVVEEGNPTYDSRNNCNAILETASNILVAGCQNTIIPNSVTSIGNSAFYGCTGLTSVTIVNSVTSIGNNAFYNCSRLDTLICKANTPPTLGNSAFKSISPTAVLCVPYEYIEAYEAISGYADSFTEIKGFSHVEDITDTTATLKWIPDSAVIQYDINVYTADTLFAHYVVDGNGQIISSQHYAPSIYYHKLDTTVSSTEYFVISLVGLSAGTSYSYTIDGINAHNAPIYHEEGSFKTMDEGEEGLFDVILDDPRKQTQKFIRDGMLFIERNGVIYSPQGIKIQTQNQ